MRFTISENADIWLNLFRAPRYTPRYILLLSRTFFRSLTLAVLESYRRREDRLFSLASSLSPATSDRREDMSEKPVCNGYCPRTEWSHNVVGYLSGFLSLGY